MKIGYLVCNLDVRAGWGRYAKELTGEMRRQGHDVVIIKETADSYDANPVLIRRGWSMLRTNWPRILRLLRDCDLIHGLDLYPYGFIAAIAATILRKKLVLTGIGTYSVAPLYNPRTAWFARWVYRRADCVISISRYTESEILRLASPRDHVVIPHGIDTTVLRARIRNPNAEPYILSVGGLKRRKGYHISIEAFARAHQNIPELKYIIVGNQRDQKYFAELRELVRHHGLAHAVVFREKIPDDELAQLYADAQLFLLLSVNHDHHFEGFGLAFMEAAALGLPCIGTRNNGIADAVDDGVTGMLVEQNNPAAAAEAITRIINDKDLREKMSRAAVMWAQKHTIEDMVNKYIAIYKRLLSQ